MPTIPHELKLLAPISGQILPMEQVPDPVFAQKIVGPGLAIDPTSTTLCAPIAGQVVQLHRAHHAVALRADSGLQILLHIGIDTVKLGSQGFHPLVSEGQRVQAGQPLIDFDADFIATKAKSLITVMIITEGATEKDLQLTAACKVNGGQDVVISVGSLAVIAPRVSTSASQHSPEIHIHLPTGLHARPAALLAGMAKSFASEIQIVKGPKSANAKSVVGIMGLEITKGDHVQFAAQGSDAAQAIKDLAEFLSDLEESSSLNTSSHTRSVSQEGVLGGVGVSPGLAIGRIYQIRSEKLSIPEQGSQGEKEQLHSTLTAARLELKTLRDSVKTQSEAAIFSAHEELLQDPDLTRESEAIIAQGKSAAWAWNEVIQTHAHRLAHLNNEMMANRANDLKDVGLRVLRLLLGVKSTKQEMPDQAILIAENLTPSETVQLDRRKVVAFATTTGGATSHVAILARSLGLPAIAGLDEQGLQLLNGTEVILDGDSGQLRLNPTSQERQTAFKQQQAQGEKRQAALKSAHQPALTRDSQRFEVAANIGSAEDARQAVQMGADGVGLLRSEFLFLEREQAPSEQEQHQVYQEIADILGPRTLVIRTLDVGGDKPLKYLPIESEENPFLGIRGIRVGFLHPPVLRQQLRAILRVKTQGQLCVMFPMIATLEEFRKAKAILEEERKNLNAPPVQVGIMIEVPSVALIADALARECDFFSVGTNDLTQYTLAMDRGHKGLAKQVDALHPSVLMLIERAARAAKSQGKWIGVCGGLASDVKAVEILLGLGINELSVSIPSVPLIKSAVRAVSLSEAQELAKKALLACTAQEVRDLKKSSHSIQGSANVEDRVFISAEDR